MSLIEQRAAEALTVAREERAAREADAAAFRAEEARRADSAALALVALSPLAAWLPGVDWRVVDRGFSYRTVVVVPADDDEPPIPFIVTRQFEDNYTVQIAHPARMREWRNGAGVSPPWLVGATVVAGLADVGEWIERQQYPTEENLPPLSTAPPG